MAAVVGGPGTAGGRLPAHRPHPAPACPVVRRLEVGGRPDRRPSRTGSRAPATTAIPRSSWTAALVPTRDRTVAASGRNYRHSTDHQVVIDADTRLVVTVGKPLPGNRDDCRAGEDSGTKAAVGTTPTVIADGGHRGHRPGHPALPPAQERRTAVLEGGPQRLPPQGPRPPQAHLRPHEELEDLARLPPQRRWCSPCHARHRTPAQTHPHRMTDKRAGRHACLRSFTGQPPAGKTPEHGRGDVCPTPTAWSENQLQRPSIQTLQPQTDSLRPVDAQLS